MDAFGRALETWNVAYVNLQQTAPVTGITTAQVTSLDTPLINAGNKLINQLQQLSVPSAIRRDFDEVIGDLSAFIGDEKNVIATWPDAQAASQQGTADVARLNSAGAILAADLHVTLTTTTTTTTTTVVSTLPLLSGIYVDGTQGTPHYFISLTTRGDGTVTGSIDFLYQDGQTSVVITFTGTTQSGTATLSPTSVPQTGSAAENPDDVPSAISATYTQDSIGLGECTSYLHFAESVAQCSFSFSPGGVQ